MGLGSSRWLAKLATDHCKPDGFHEVPEDQEREFLRDVPVQKLAGIAKRGGEKSRQVANWKAGVLDDLKGWEPTEAGTPQGAVISPLLANRYLNPLDHEMAERGWEMVRYADDLVVLCRTREEVERAMAYLQHWAAEALALPTSFSFGFERF